MPVNDVFVRMRLNCLKWTIFAFALLAPLAEARAQLKPDAVILIQPNRDGAELAVVYSRTSPHRDAEARIAKLGTVSGWTVRSAIITDQTIEIGGGKGKGGKPVGKQTEVAVSLTRAPQLVANAFFLQPYLEAFSDLGRIEILYVFPRDSRFNGIREFDSPEMSLRLINPGGPYRYVVDFKRHGAKLANVPLTQPVVGAHNTASASTTASVPPERTDNTARTLLLIFGIASISGILAYALLRLWGRHQASGSRGSAGNLSGSAGRLSRL